MQFSIYLSFSKESGRAEWCSGRCPARVLIGPGGGQSGWWRSVSVCVWRALGHTSSPCSVGSGEGEG